MDPALPTKLALPPVVPWLRSIGCGLLGQDWIVAWQGGALGVPQQDLMKVDVNKRGKTRPF